VRSRTLGLTRRTSRPLASRLKQQGCSLLVKAAGAT
jgi:hypothetical protein